MSQEQEMVFAIHPFQAMRDDEINFDYGEPIIVIEKDDMYGDGWWKGQNIHGKIGLFPMSHTKSYNKPPLDNIIITSPEPNDVENNNNNNNSNNSNNSNSIISDTIEDLRNKLQVMINNNNNRNRDSKRSSKKSNSSKSRLSTSTTSTSSYFSARINSDLSSSRNSLYQHSQIINPSRSSIAFDDDHNLTINNINIKGHPSTWDVYQVCDWLNENGFGSESKKFIENDVTGDVLLGLDLEALKEININSFGKRVHILNTISSLKDQYSIIINEDHSKSQFGDPYDLNTTRFNDTSSDSQNTLVNDPHNNNQLNDLKSDLNPATYYNALPPPLGGSEKSEKSERKVPKKSSLTFLKFGFGKSNKEEKKKSEKEKSEKSEKPRPSFSGGWDFILDDGDTKGSENDERPKNNSPSLYDESMFELEKNSSLRLIPGKKKKISFDRKGVVGSQLGLPTELLDNDISEKRESRVNSYYSEYNVDYINTNNEVLKKIGIPNHDGWLKKQGDKYKNWKSRFCILKGSTLYYLKSGDKTLQTAKIKGRIDIIGYKVIPDENLYQGKYGFKLLHDTERPHFFAHEDLEILRGWMRAIMKTTIDIGKTVISSSDHIPTVSLHEARKVANRMHQPRPAPTPPNKLSPILSPILSPPLSPLSPPNILINNSIPANILSSTSTFSNLPPRPAPSPPISPVSPKSTITIPLSSLPKPKAPPTGALPPPPPEHDHSSLRNITKSPPPPEHDHSSSQKVIKPPPFQHGRSSQSIVSRTNYSKSQIQDLPTKMPKFPSMTLTLLNASRNPHFISKNNKYNEIPMGYYV